jgi:hypothetical protein
MSYVSLDDAKKWMEVFITSDDDIIQQSIDGAESYAAQYMGRLGIYDGQDWEDLDSPSESSSSGDMVPPSVVQAILFITADDYEYRTQTIVGTIANKLPAAEQMMHFYRIGLGV